MINLPIIITTRLMLRPLSKKDAKAIFRYAQLPNVGPSAGWNPHHTMQDTYEFIEYALNKRKLNQPGVWVIEEKASNEVIGTIEIHSFEGYKGEIGFVLHPDYWNKGYMTEASEAVMIYAFEELLMSRLAYCHFLDNYASRRVREKLGFKVEGIKRRGFKHANGKVLDEIVSSFTKDDYFEEETRFNSVKEKITIIK
ncbi:MAG: GNAT family N-acetyltransferase [Candidatus Izemoplasmataceae bacterium]